MSTPDTTTEPDYSTARQWLRDEGYDRADLVTPEQMRAAAQELYQNGRDMLDLAEEVIAEMCRAEVAAKAPTETA